MYSNTHRTHVSATTQQTSTHRGHNSIVGTPYYMAPEILERERYDHNVDWWAMGVLVYECCLGYVPFGGDSLPAVFAAIRQAQIEWGPLQALDPILTSMVQQLLEPDPNKRLGSKSTDEIKNHEYFKGIDFDTLAITGKPPFFPTSTVNETPLTGHALEQAERYFYSREMKR
ncbi:unnamed protein product, partial [Heterosigma akashiwo]